MAEPSVFGRRLQAFRKRRGLSQNQLAQRSGVPRPTISSLESGAQLGISLENALKLAAALNVTVDMLAHGDPLEEDESRGHLIAAHI